MQINSLETNPTKVFSFLCVALIWFYSNYLNACKHPEFFAEFLKENRL